MPEDDIELRYMKMRGVRFLDWSDLDLDGLGRSSAEIAREARNTIHRFEDEAEQIRADDHLSDEGKRAKLEHLVERNPDLSLAPLRSRLEGYREKLEKRREELRASVVEEPDPTDARTAMLEREVREKFNSLDVADRRRFLSRAVEEGDQLSLRATLFAPSSLVELSDDRREQYQETLVQQVAGEDLQEVEAELEAVERAEQEVESAERVLELEIEGEHAAPQHEGDRRAERNRRHQEEAREREAEAAAS